MQLHNFFQNSTHGDGFRQPNFLLYCLHSRAVMLFAASGQPSREHVDEAGDGSDSPRCSVDRLHGGHHRQHSLQQLGQGTRGHGLGRGQAGQRNAQHFGQSGQAEGRDQRIERHRCGQLDLDGEEVHRRTSENPSATSAGSRT